MNPYVEQPGSRFRDRLDPKVSDWIQPYRAESKFDVAILGAPLSKTSISHSAASRLPDAIRTAFQALTPYSINHQLDLSDTLKVTDIGNVKMHLTDLSLCQQNIEHAVHAYATQYAAPLVVIGGDHSITGAVILGLTRASKSRYGIVHFDAHHDVRNLEDGGRTNGTPFRTLLSSNAIDGNRVVQIGLRDYVNAKAYHAYVQAQGVTVYTARQVWKQGLQSVVEQAMSVAGQDTDAVYVSFDMDVLDQSFVPGVPAPSPGGLTVWDAIEAMEWLGKSPKVGMLDIVCADPTQDVRDFTTRVASTLVLSFLTGIGLRSR